MPDPAAAIAATTDDGPDRGQPEAWAEEGPSSSMSSYAAGEKRLTLLNGISLIVCLQIGSGIFSSPGVIVAYTQSVGASLAIWTIAALLSWSGASSFAELGASLPRNGGAQAYLGYTYGPLASYLFTWTMASLLSPGTKAVNSLVFAEYFNRVLWNVTRGDQAPSEVIPHWVLNATAVASVFFVAFLVVGTRSLGPRTTVILTSIKIFAVLSIIVLAFIHALLGRSHLHLDSVRDLGPSPTVASYAHALYAALWAFDGFNQANYVAGEMQNPERDVPRAIHASMGLVAVLFLVVNVAYFSVLDMASIAQSNTVALDFGWALFGSAGGMVYAILVTLSCLGALTGSLFTSTRVVYAAARLGQLPGALGVLDAKRGTPIRAVILQATLTISLIFLGDGFRSLLRITIVALWAFYFLTVLAVVILRVREPDLHRPYRTWITTPLIFCAVTIFVLCVPALSSPRETLIVACYVGAGVPAYYITRKRAVSQDEGRIRI